MRDIFYSILLVAILLGCNSREEELDIRSRFGNFNGNNILLKPVDYLSAPIAKKIEHHPELFNYLNDVQIFSMAYNSDSLMISGFMVQPKKPGKLIEVVIKN